ncbi:MAG: hypothetical protein MMC23_008114 [Stictis urceolatum]|nr:hypothetical protein [Stictis urceolata]
MEIFEAQTAALRYELGDGHTYEFVQATIPCDPAPEIASTASSEASYYSYFDPESPQTFARALDQLDKYLSTEGPFDGAIAFSQGASLIASYLISMERAGRKPFSCTILFSTPPVIDPASVEEHTKHTQLRLADPDTYGCLISTPTVHIWGDKDKQKATAERLSMLCDPAQTNVYVHDGDHEIPSLKSKRHVVETVKVIRRLA